MKYTTTTNATLAILVSTTLSAHSAVLFTNDLKGFTGTTDDGATITSLSNAGFNPGETATTTRRVTFGGSGATFGLGTGGDNGRNTLRTNDADYHTISFVSRVVFTTNSEQHAFYLGMGAGEPGVFGLPDWSSTRNTISGIYDRRRGPDDFQIRTNNVDVAALRPIFGNGTHEAIFTWNAATGMATFEYDLGNDGSIDGSQSYDASGLIAEWNGGEESRLYVGGDDGVIVSDWAVTAIPEPSSTALLGLGGVALIFRRRK